MDVEREVEAAWPKHAIKLVHRHHIHAVEQTPVAQIELAEKRRVGDRIDACIGRDVGPRLKHPVREAPVASPDVEHPKSWSMEDPRVPLKEVDLEDRVEEVAAHSPETGKLEGGAPEGAVLTEATKKSGAVALPHRVGEDE